MINKENDYFSFLDIARGIAILFVVFGHSIVPEIRGNNIVFATVFNWIYSFHMPLFAVISGYLFGKSIDRYKERTFLTFVKQKFLTLIIPYLSVSIISYVGFAVAHQIPFLSGILSNTGYNMPQFWRSVYEILLCQNNMDRHMWFAYALFFVFVLSYPLSDLVRRPIGIIVAGSLFLLNYYGTLAEVFYRVFYLWIFFTIACQENLIDKLLKKGYIVAVLPVHIATFIIRNSNVLVPYEIADALLAMLVGLSGAILVMSFAKNFLQPSANKLLSFLGKESFSIYILHQPFIVSGICGILLAATNVPHILICVGTTILGVAVSIFLSKILIGKFEVSRKLILGKFNVSKASRGG